MHRGREGEREREREREREMYISALFMPKSRAWHWLLGESIGPERHVVWILWTALSPLLVARF